jgi:hypothetical protein
MRLLDLSPELLFVIAAQLHEDDELVAFALACRRLRQAVAATERHMAGARLSTEIGSVFGSVGKLEWAVSSCGLQGGLPLHSGMLVRAARGGQLEQLSWLRSRGCAWEPCMGHGEDPCSAAAAGGHLLVLQWARANGCPWDEDTCRAAALGGHLAVLQWLHAHDCHWEEGTFSAAARSGHPAVLQWQHANCCPWDEDTCSAAAGAGVGT